MAVVAGRLVFCYHLVTLTKYYFDVIGSQISRVHLYTKYLDFKDRPATFSGSQILMMEVQARQQLMYSTVKIHQDTLSHK